MKRYSLRIFSLVCLFMVVAYRGTYPIERCMAKKLKLDILPEKQDLDLEEAVSENQISNLPDNIISYILSLLPTVDAIQTSLVCKQWRRYWQTITIVDIVDYRDAIRFRRRDIYSTGRKSFIRFIDACLRYQFPDTTITKFKLRVTFGGLNSHVDNWFPYRVMRNVSELDVYIQTRKAYTLPDFVLELESLTNMKLSCLAVKTTRDSVCLPRLKVLNLYRVELNDQMANSLSLGCPSLEKLQISFCTGLSEPKLSSTSLKQLDFSSSGTIFLRGIRVEADNLVDFFFEGDIYRMSRVNLIRCPKVRYLRIIKAYIDDQWSDNLSQLTSLESLNLVSCNVPRDFKIKNHHMKDFVFSLEAQLDSVTMETPSLTFFHYIGKKMFGQTLVSASSLVDVYIRIFDQPRKSYDHEWYSNLLLFLAEFNHCNKVDMFCANKKALIIPDQMRKTYPPPFPDLKRLKVKSAGSALFRRKMFRNSLLWIAPSVETLSIE